MASQRENQDDNDGPRRCSCLSSLGDDLNEETIFKTTHGHEAHHMTSTAAYSSAAAATTAASLGSQTAAVSSAVGEELIQIMRQLLQTQERQWKAAEPYEYRLPVPEQLIMAMCGF